MNARNIISYKRLSYYHSQFNSFCVFSASKPSTFPKPERSRTSSLSVATPSSAASHAVKEQVVTKESSAIDVLDQIINASLGNYKNTIISDAFSNSSSKLVDNALMSLVSGQQKAPPRTHSTSAGPTRANLPAMSSPGSLSQHRTSPAISIVMASPTVVQSSPNIIKHATASPSLGTGLTDTPKSVLQTPSESIYKSFEKYLNDNTQSQGMSITPIGKAQSTVATSVQMPSQVSPHSALAKTQADAGAPYRSSYEFHEAFLNSLNSADPSRQNVMKSPTKSSNVMTPEVSMSGMTTSGYMKKQDFYSQNRGISLLGNTKTKQSENISKSAILYASSSTMPRSSPKSVDRFCSQSHVNYIHGSSHGHHAPSQAETVYSNATMPRSSPQSVDRLKLNSPVHGNYIHGSAQVDTVYTNAAESLASIVNLAVEKPRKSPVLMPNVATHRPSKTVIQSPNNFIQDGLASSLLQHHASFSSDKWQEKLQSGGNFAKTTSPKSEHYNVSKYQTHGKHDMEVNRTSPIAVSGNMGQAGWPTQKRIDLPNSFSAPIVNKCTVPNLNNDAMAATFRHPSPSNTSLPKCKSPGSSSAQVSPPYGKYPSPHHVKAYPLISPVSIFLLLKYVAK